MPSQRIPTQIDQFIELTDGFQYRLSSCNVYVVLREMVECNARFLIRA